MSLTATGYDRERLAEILAAMQEAIEAELGEMNWSGDSVISILTGIYAERLALIEEKIEDVYLSQYPASAEGVALDNVVALTGITRLAATYSSAKVALQGSEGTIVPLGFKGSVEGTGEIFDIDAATTITESTVVRGTVFFYLSASLGATYTVTINGTPFSHTQSGVQDGAFVALQIHNAINAGAEPVTSTYEALATGANIVLNADDPEVNFSLSVNLAASIMAVRTIWTSTDFTSTNQGEILALTNTLNTIVTPVAGLNEISNFSEGTSGRDVETDIELRLRRALALSIVATSTVEAIRTELLQNVENVASAQVFENETNIQNTITITFDADFVTGNNVDVTYNGSALAPVPFNTDTDTTLQDVADEIALKPEVFSAVITGTPTNTIEITPVTSEYIVINSVVVTGGASQAGANITGNSRPPKSFEVIIEGGTDADVGQKIWDSKPAGIKTFGFEFEAITDSMGIVHNIEFTRPFDLEYYLHIAMTYNTEETFPTSGLDAIKEAVLAVANAFVVGQDVILNKFIPAIYETPGVATVSLTWDLVGGGGPYANSNNIVIAETQISKLTLARIGATIV